MCAAAVHHRPHSCSTGHTGCKQQAHGKQQAQCKQQARASTCQEQTTTAQQRACPQHSAAITSQPASSGQLVQTAKLKQLPGLAGTASRCEDPASVLAVSVWPAAEEGP